MKSTTHSLFALAPAAFLLCFISAPSLAAAPQGGHPKVACDLLSDPEIMAVQGAQPQSRKPSGWVADFAVSQCYFELPSAAQSITLAVFEQAPGKQARSPRQAWPQMFVGKKNRETESHERRREQEAEQEEQQIPPQRVKGLGDAAYWAPSRVGGFLYVLRGRSFFRIGVGGGDEPSLRKGKAIQLARHVLRH